MSAFTKQSCSAALLCFALLLFAAHAGARQDAFPSNMEAAHRVVLESWLKQKPNLRPATAEDLGAEFLVRLKEMSPESAASPFYIAGDFNHDDRKDFAVGLVNKNSPGKLVLAVFNAPFGKKTTPAFYDESMFEMTDIFFIVADRKNREELQIGIGNDTRTVLLKPKGKSYFIWTGPTQ
ncbi:MAG TPA: hypothetical protein VEQ40_03015 [Pyrinomonadaceae bacterium]|nr:hypothetical protein [Pyrinomonadaceae bacterium]